ncbi:protein kinase domain-containing protein [Dyella sp.]|uniref:protein kinase domain-containing protein n=1 Tax=Dyella sp. TaxID=1869338 RepID=UPI002D76E744|nr:protein kinase [Dyella sp.]HET6431191.1 protein kinase [Dyella sp.]
MRDPDLPRTLGRYRIEGVLGAGAMAVVYAGYDPQIQREVAIKCLHAHVAADPAYRRRFQVEARAAGHLSHPNIVTVFDVGETDDGRSYLAMERLPGDTLASRAARDGLPPLSAVIELASQMAAALDYAHANGVVHHDIKPENIMLADGWRHAKIADFGIAERRGVPRQAGAGEIGGTPAYMAPEQLRGDETDARSDLFSLGVVLYWLLSGKLPWSETVDVPRLLDERQQLPLPPLEPLDAAAPSILVDIVHTLLSPLARDRYQRGSELADDLAVARREYERLHEQPLASRIVSLRLRWAAVLAGMLSVILLLGMIAIYIMQGRAITGLALDFGSSLGHMVASESAEDLLLGDRAATRALVQDIARNQQIRYLAIADRDGHIVASTRQADIGQAMPDIALSERLGHSGEIDSYRGHPDAENSDGLLLFNAPIHYQTATVGTLRLGISQAPLGAAQKTTLGVIGAVLVVTLLAVIGAAYVLFRRLLTPLALVGDALLRVARGDLRYRIRLMRRDEFGRLFAAFNLMAGALQSRQRRPAAPTRPVRPVDATLPTRIVAAAERRKGDAAPPGG